MRRIVDPLEVIGFDRKINGLNIVDVGCGTGDLARQLSSQGAKVFGIDSLRLIKLAKESPHSGNETYISANGENLPFKKNTSHLIIYFASLHHIPEKYMKQSLQECHRILKQEGTAIILEPMGLEGSYYEVIKLVEDEREIQQRAYEAIQNAQSFGLKCQNEEIIYFERSFKDYTGLLEIFVEDSREREGYLNEARSITEELCQEAKVSLDDFRFKSIARVSELIKR